MSIILYKLTATAVPLDDLGLTVSGIIGTTYALTSDQANDIYDSANGGDLQAAINGTSPFTVPELLLVDPRAGYTGNLNAANSLIALRSSNDVHYGIQGAKIADLDDVSGTPNNNDVLQFSGGTFSPVAPSTIAGSIILGDLNDVDDPGTHTAGVIYTFKGDGTNLDVVDFTSDAAVAEAVEDIIGGAFISGTDTTFVYTDGSGTMQVNVDDVFLRNTGDTLDSGTLTIASGASINIATGGDLTIVDAPVNPTDAVNKAYADSIAAGLDPKESVRGGTVTAIGGTYNSTGGTGGTGAFTGVDLTSDVIFDGVPTEVGGFVIGDRILIKDESGVATAVINAGGTGYTGGDVLTLTGGTFTTAATVTVDSVTLGVIDSVTLTTQGVYSILPSSPAGVTGGTGAGDATIDITASDLQNGIYVVTTAGAAGAIERAPDQDGSPANEVSAGNYTFIENGSTLSSTGWILLGDGILTLNTDPIVWAQFNAGQTYTAGDGLALGGNAFSLDINNLTAATIVLADEIAFNDISGPNAPRNTTVTNFLADLDIVTATGSNGIIVKTANDTYTSRSIAVDGAGALDGLAIANGDGVSGNPTVGLDINGLPVRSDAIDQTDRVAVYNISTGANEYYTVGDISNAGAANAFGIITGDSGIATADSPSDTVSFTGYGITTTATAGAAAAVDFALNISDLTAGAGTLVLADEIAVNDGGSTLRYTFTDVVQDLDVVTATGAAGFIVKTANDTYASRTITVDGVGNLDGLAITNGAGTAGNPVIGLDITGNAAAGENLAAADEVIVYNASATANQKMTGTEIANGVSSILNLTGLTVTTIGGQEVLTLIDTTRGNKVLSIESTTVMWSENKLNDSDWIQIGNANDALIGYVVPLNATIVKISAVTTNDQNIAKTIDLYVDQVLNTAGIVAFSPATNGENTFTNVTLNIDLTAGDKIQLRAASSPTGEIQDTVVTIWFKWRG